MNFLRTIFDSCAHFRTYRAFRDLPVTSSLKYLIKLMALLSLVGLIAFLPVVSEMVENFAQWADRHLPVIELKDGQVNSSVEQPFRTGDTNFLFILDTTGKTAKPETNSLQGLLVTADSLVFWLRPPNEPTAEPQVQHQSLRRFPNGRLNGDYFRQLIHSFAWVAFPIALLLIIGVALLTSLVQAYIFAFLASWIERGNPRGLRLAQLLNIAIHAVTPAAIIYTVYLSLRLEGVDLWLMYLVIYGVFVVGASNACRDHLPSEEHEEDELL
jgi:hypothetical protein